MGGVDSHERALSLFRATVAVFVFASSLEEADDVVSGLLDDGRVELASWVNAEEVEDVD